MVITDREILTATIRFVSPNHQAASRNRLLNVLQAHCLGFYESLVGKAKSERCKPKKESIDGTLWPAPRGEIASFTHGYHVHKYRIAGLLRLDIPFSHVCMARQACYIQSQIFNSSILPVNPDADASYPGEVIAANTILYHAKHQQRDEWNEK